MKKLTLLFAAVCLVKMGLAQDQYYDFSEPNESGQVLYYNILDSVAHTVEFTCPGKHDYLGGWSGGYQQPQGQLLLPSTVNHDGQNYSVVALGDWAFYNCNQINGNIIVPHGIIRLGKHCLENLYQQIDTIFLPEGLVEVDDEACAENKYIDSLPSTLERIGLAGFADIDFKGHLILPPSLRVLGGAAFSSCYSISEVTLPENLDSIGGEAFYYAVQLRQINFNAKNCSYIASSAFEECTSVSSIIIGEQVQSIIPRISTYPNTIYLKGQTPPVISENTFAGINAVFCVPKGCWDNYHNAPYWSDISRLYEIPGSFAPEGAEWYYNKLSTQSILNDFHHIEVLGTTAMTVNGDHVEVSVISSPLHSGELQYVYEKDDVVYWYDSAKEMFTTLYDYNAGVGDTWTVSIDSTDYEVLVVARQNKVYNHCRYQIQWVRSINSQLGFNGKIIKGIGYEHGMFPFVIRPGVQDTTYINGIRCYLEDDTLYYHNGYLDCDQIVGWDGYEWYYEILNDNGSITYQHLEYTSDTVIQGERPKIIVRTNTIYDDKKQQIVTHEYVFEKEGKVYWWNKQLQLFTTLYDYSAETGDEWEIMVGTEKLTMHVDSVMDYPYEDKTYRMLCVSDADNFFSGNIICGIGHLTSFFPEWLMNQGKGYRVDGMRCYWVDGDLILKNGDTDCDEIYDQHHHSVIENDDETFAVHPNPTTGVFTVTGENLKQIEVFDVLGQRITSLTANSDQTTIDLSGQPAGVYLVNVIDLEGKLCVKKVVKQ